MLYTKEGDDGKTKFLECNQRFSKSSIIAEALGDIDEFNSFLGFCKIKVENIKFDVLNGVSFYKVLHKIQNDIFIIQVEITGGEKTIKIEKIKYLENIIDNIEKQIPPIKNFIIYGGTEVSSLFDWGRAICRRVERKAVAAKEENKISVSNNAIAYLNRLSSLLYALARLINHKSDIKEEFPNYE